MSFTSPPPSDDCPGLTPDNGTPTSSCSGFVNGQAHQNALYIYENVNHQASPSGTINIPEHNRTPERIPPTSRIPHPRSPHPGPTVPPPNVGLRALHPTEDIPPLDIGSSLLPRSSSLTPPRRRSPPVIKFAGEPTAIHSSPPSSSRCPTLTPRAESLRGSRPRFLRLRSLLPNISAWFGRKLRANRDEARPRRRLSLSWFFRRRNART